MFSCCDVFCTVTGGDCIYFMCSLYVVHKTCFSCCDVLCSGNCIYLMCSLYVVHKTCLAVVMCYVVGIVYTLCVPCMLYTKHVQRDDGLLIRSKHFAPLNSCIFSCVDCYYVITTLKHKGTSNFQKFNLFKIGQKYQAVCEYLSAVTLICPNGSVFFL